MIVEGLGFHLAPLRLPTTETQPGGLCSFHAKKVQKIPLITHAFCRSFAETSALRWGEAACRGIGQNRFQEACKFLA